jgi:hypothetical protein
MKTIVVLGMHRSATSLVARTLNSEVHMGKNLLVGLKDNPKGHYENVHIIRLNDQILHQSGGSWHNPPPIDKIMEIGAKYKDEMNNIISAEISIAEEKGLDSWGFKDPRTALTIGAWLEHLPNPQFVVCYRNPLDIAKSLNKRNNFTIDKGLKLTLEYNRRINIFIAEWLNKNTQ